MVKIIFLEEFGKAFVPRRFTPYLRKYLAKAGIYSVPYKFFGALFYLTAMLTGTLYMLYLYPFLTKYSSIIMLVGSMVSWFSIQIFFAVLIILLIYFYLDIRIYQRTKKMEELLPDFLQIVSSNLKGGMSFENSLFGAIKPRFSVLANEMSEVSKKVMTGYSVGVALQEFSSKYDSPMLGRSIDLMISEVESGGHITDVIDNLVGTLKETQTLKKDISASAVTYMIFIGAIVIFIAPLLFALSYHLLIIIMGFVGKLSSVTARSDLPLLSVKQVQVDPFQFKIFSYAALLIISFFSSMIVSILEKGSIKSGLKYIPVFTAGSVIFYYIFMKILSFLFHSLSV